MNTKFQPLVTVIVPCYNHGQYLTDSLGSLLEQTYTNWECVIVDNASTDNTKEIVNSFSEKDKRFKYLYHSIPGVSGARNSGIKISNGDYILPLDADDKIENTYLEKALNILADDPSVKIVYCEAELFGTKAAGKWNLPAFDLKDMLMENCIFCTAMFRRSDFEKSGGFNENMHIGFEDWDFWLSMLEQGGGVFKIPETLFYYRIQNRSRNNSLTLKMQQQLRLQVYANHSMLYKAHNLSEADINNWYKIQVKIEKRKKSRLRKIASRILAPFRRK